MPDSLSPLSAYETFGTFDTLLPQATTIAVAVSGGSDSMALAWCAKQWADTKNIEVVAFIVDHALRIESATEAAQVKQKSIALGIKTDILRWDHDPVRHKIHEQARKARYDLLLNACKARNIEDLLLGHHREDQAETILMRFSKGSGIEGLAGMARQTMRDGVRLARPFLDMPKTRLVATCQAAGIDFVDDPSNQSEKFARGRLRKIMPVLAAEGLSIDRLIDLGARAAEANDALEQMATSVMRAAVRVERGGDIHINRTLLMGAPRAIALRVLTACLRQIHKGDHPPERDALLGLWDAMKQGDNTRTLCGCLIATTEKDVHILREAGAATEEMPFVPDTPLLWDGRWLVQGRVEKPDTALTVRALGNPPHDLVDRLAPALRQQIPRGRVRATLPAVWKGDDLYAIPHFDGTALLRVTPSNEMTIVKP